MSISLLNKQTQVKPKIYFTPTAWCKMRTWVKETQTQECALEGVVEHVKDTNLYIVKDVLVYPQMDGNGAFVTTDDDKYMTWSLTLPDEVINNKRFQMHSHVKMQPNPSGTDHTTWERLMQVTDDYMIFMIMNIQGDFSLYLYDKIQNLIYDKEEIETDVLFVNEENKYIPAKDWYIINREKYITKAPVKTGFNTQYNQGWYNSDKHAYQDEAQSLKEYLSNAKDKETKVKSNKEDDPDYCHVAKRVCLRAYSISCGMDIKEPGYCDQVNGYCQVLEKFNKAKLKDKTKGGKTSGSKQTS